MILNLKWSDRARAVLKHLNWTQDDVVKFEEWVDKKIFIVGDKYLNEYILKEYNKK